LPPTSSSQRTHGPAIAHKGFALVDILQPCVTFNKKNTYQWYGKMVYKLPADHDAADRVRAFALSLEWEERIPIGVLYAGRTAPHSRNVTRAWRPAAARARDPAEAVRDLLRKRLFTLP